MNQRPWQRSLGKITRFASRILGICGLLILLWMGINWFRLQQAATGSIDAFLVLGGGIQREIYAAEIAKINPTIPILISQGSADPCIWMMFQLRQAPMDQVWLEKCARSTFDNFFFSIPTLQRWQVRKVKLITSVSHTPRALWMAQILLGSHGIWVEPEIIPDLTPPGNKEEDWKTAIDLARSLGWAVLSQFSSPECEEMISLTEVNFSDWQEMGFRCERRPNPEIKS